MNRQSPTPHSIEEIKIKGCENNPGQPKAIDHIPKLLEGLYGWFGRHMQ